MNLPMGTIKAIYLYTRHGRKAVTGQRKAGVLRTFLKAVAGAISAPLRVRSRNMGQEDAFIRNPVKKTSRH